VELTALKAAVPGFGAKSHNDKIKVFGWWLHTYGNQSNFSGSDILKCYDKLDFAKPSSIGPYLAPLVDKKELLKSPAGYRLEHGVRAQLDALYGQPVTTAEISGLLRALPGKLPTLTESEYLEEALTCYHSKAFRAAIVMTWNLAYAHLCDYVVANKLAEFNGWWQQQYRGDHKNGPRAIAVATDFADEELTEHKVLKICLDAGIITKNVYNVLHAALGRRNAAAHPNSVVLKQLQVDAYIDDLVNNAVLKIR
jgi:hypothetical protein